MALPALWLALALAASDEPLTSSPSSARARPDAPTTRSRWMALDEAQQEAELAALSKLPLGERLLAVSERFVGTPYLASPLGEGEGKDPDPRFRLDAVDCLTFVEQAIAMSLTPSIDEVEPVLARIRYSEEPSYAGRNHLMEAEWLPNNVRKGFLRDVTRLHGGVDAKRLQKSITPATWTSRTSATLELPPERRRVGEFPIAAVPLEKVLEKARAVPSGTILVVVRDERPLLPTRVSHLGFVVQKRRPVLRHASRTHGRVVDEDLETFLARNGRYTKWKVVGAGFYEVTAPPR